MKGASETGTAQSQAGFEQNVAARFRTQRFYLVGIAGVSPLIAGVARAQYGQYQPGQYPILENAANRVIQKYQNSSYD